MEALVKQSSIALLLLFKENVQREKSDKTKFGIFLKLRLAALLRVIWCAEKRALFMHRPYSVLCT